MEVVQGGPAMKPCKSDDESKEEKEEEDAKIKKNGVQR